VVRRRCTCRARRRPPTHLLDHPHWAAPRTTKVARPHRFTSGHDSASVTSVVPTGAHFHRWRLGFKQSSLGHIARVSRHPALDASRRPPLPWHALVPSRFRVQVNQATQKPPFEFLPAAPGIQRRASRRTPAVPISRQRALHGVCRQAGFAGGHGVGILLPRWACPRCRVTYPQGIMASRSPHRR
jgi:hypothetical protein